MTTVQASIDKQLILANDFFALLKTSDDFLEWMYRRITDFDMKINHDFYIFLDSEAVKELAGYETFYDREARKSVNKAVKLK
jgi:phage anti-repressor protein